MVSCLMGDSTALASAIVRCCPKFFLGLYFVVLLVNMAALLVWIVQHFMGPYPDLGHKILVCLGVFDGIWMFLLRLMFWSRDGSTPYER